MLHCTNNYYVCHLVARSSSVYVVFGTVIRWRNNKWCLVCAPSKPNHPFLFFLPRHYHLPSGFYRIYSIVHYSHHIILINNLYWWFTREKESMQDYLFANKATANANVISFCVPTTPSRTLSCSEISLCWLCVDSLY